ncbi:unnamed protein product [Linum trigynum]|uniref:Nuclear transcription factor Y subunit n=1 Tax=Linum trigynum TaxID=586398 RepID=A0AAV2GJJ0_9ROSI
MQSKPGAGHSLPPDSHVVLPSYGVPSEPWWRGVGYHSVAAGMPIGNAKNSTEGSESTDDQSVSDDRTNEEEDNDAAKESQATASSRSVGNHGHEHPNPQNVPPGMTTTALDQTLAQPPQFELVGHSITSAPNPYQDPYYSGMMAAYAQQPLGYPHLVGVPQTRMPLPLEMAQEPVYVNAKQYQGILRRRQARAKAEVEKKLIKVRKPYLHESRHKHAMRRARGAGGRFAKKTGLNNASNSSAAEIRRSGSGPAPSSQSGGSSGSEPLLSSETWNSSKGHQHEGRVHHPQGRFEGHQYRNIDGGGHGGEDGDCSIQHRGSISSRASQRSVAIQ